jgi:hypothetical protein
VDPGFESCKHRSRLGGIEAELLELFRRTVSQASAKNHPAVPGLPSPEVRSINCVEGNGRPKPDVVKSGIAERFSRAGEGKRAFHLANAREQMAGPGVDRNDYETRPDDRAVQFEHRMRFDDEASNLRVLVKDGAGVGRRQRELGEQRHRVHRAARNGPDDAHAVPVIFPRQRLAFSIVAMRYLPTAGQSQITIDPRLFDQLRQRGNASIRSLDNPPRSPFENDSAGSSAGAVSQALCLEHHRTDAAARKMVGGRDAG